MTTYDPGGVEKGITGGERTAQVYNADGTPKSNLSISKIHGTGVSVYSTSTATLTSGVAYNIVYNTAIWDTDGYWSAGAPTRLTIPTGRAGIYSIAGNVLTTGGGGGTNVRLVYLFVNGNLVASQFDNGAVTGVNNHLSVPAIVKAAVGDYFELGVQQNSGANKTLSAGTAYGLGSFSCVFLGSL